MPVRITAYHICLSKAVKAFQAFLSFISTVVLEHLKVSRLHSGSVIETNYILQNEYGVLSEEIPRTETGRVKLKCHNEWIKCRTKLEAKKCQALLSSSSLSSSSLWRFEGVECPDFQSIAIRSGGKMFGHPPNKVFRSYLKEKEDKQQKASNRTDKRNVITEIIDEIQALGFVYVKWSSNDGYYLPLKDPDEIREYVATSLRDQMKRSKAQRTISIQQQGGRDSEDFFLGPEGKRLKKENSDCCACFRTNQSCGGTELST
jgi:hypothetical protein